MPDGKTQVTVEYEENKDRIDAELSIAICKILKDMSFKV